MSKPQNYIMLDGHKYVLSEHKEQYTTSNVGICSECALSFQCAKNFVDEGICQIFNAYFDQHFVEVDYKNEVKTAGITYSYTKKK